jgi:hypothetical protein
VFIFPSVPIGNSQFIGIGIYKVVFDRKGREQVPGLEVFAFAVEPAALKEGALHFDGRSAAAADAVQIGQQFPWPGDHERKKQLLAGGLCWSGHHFSPTSEHPREIVNSSEVL